MLQCSRARAAVPLARQKSTVAALIAPRRKAPPPAQPSDDIPLTSSTSRELFTRIRKGIAKSQSVTRDAGPQKANVFNEAYAGMNAALKRYDYETAERHWRQLQQYDLVQYLGPPQLHQLSRALVLHQVNMSSDRLRPQLRHQLFKEVAVIAAAGRAPAALKAYMQYAVRENEPQLILEVYQQYEAALLASKPAEQPETEELKDHNGVDLAHLSFDPTIHDRVEFMLFAVTAHTLLDDFHAALRLYIDFPESIQHQNTVNFLQVTLADLKQPLADRMRPMLVKLEAARLISRPHSLSKRLMRYAAKGVKQIQSIYDTVIEGLSGQDAFIAAEEALVSEYRPVAMTEALWTSFLTAFIRCGRKDLAHKVWQNMVSLGLRPGVSMYTAMLDTYACQGAVDDLTQLWSTIVKAGVQPDALSYRALISGLMKGGRIPEAMERYEEFKRLRLAESPPELAIMVFNTLLHELLLSRTPDAAGGVFKDMVAHGVVPDQVTYNTFLAYYARREDMTGLSNTIEVMRAANLYGDEFTYSSVLAGLTRVGRKDAADLVHDIMNSLGLRAGTHMYTSLITQQLTEGTDTSLNAAYRLLHLMETTPSLAPTAVTYTAILTGLHRGKWLDDEERRRRRDDILRRMANRGLQLNRVTYHILIKACLNQEHSIPDALMYYREMLARRLVTPDTYYLLLSGLVHWEQWDVGDELVREMQTLKVQMSPSTRQMVRSIQTRRRNILPDSDRRRAKFVA
ncbi:hypothetical protein BD626DRAFT_505978 [Schizophyllum amplum]|uniref:Pentacotripeptide-repeat region of PRORP domain-containing protein n=1 Tax=Schizophyllum amplum TaxID=97359 RepID=A0A550C671_9AGAR|nr:hypothetical protein BD626DRAFT_505978 [Auriculariopsis ampla]